MSQQLREANFWKRSWEKAGSRCQSWLFMRCKREKSLIRADCSPFTDGSVLTNWYSYQNSYCTFLLISCIENFIFLISLNLLVKCAVSVSDIFRYLPSTALLSQKEIRGSLLLSTTPIGLHKAFYHSSLKADRCEQILHSEVLPYITEGES